MEFEQTSLLREANMPFMARVFGAENTKYSNKNNNNTKMKMMQVNAEEVGVAAQEHLRHDRLRAWQYSLPANIEHSASHPLVWGHENHEVVATKIAGGASHHAADIFTDEDRRELRAELLAAAQEQPQHSSSPGLFRQRMRELQTRVEEQMEVHRGISRAMLDLDRLEREARQQRAEAHTQTLVHLLRQRQSSVLRRVFGGDDDGLNFTTTPTPQQPTTTTTTTQQPTTTTTTSTAQPTQAPTTTGVVPTTQASSSASPALQDLLKTFSQPRRKPATATTTTNDARVADVAPRVVSRVDVVQPPPPPPSYIITRWVRVEPATSTPTREEEHEETIISNNNTNIKMDELHEVESNATSVRDDASSVAPSSVVEEVDDDDDDAHEAATSSSTSSLSTHVADDADNVASSMEDVASIPEDDGVASAIHSEVVDDVVDDLDDDLHRHHDQQRVDGMNVAALREVLEQFYVACKHGNALTSALISAPPTTLKDVLPQNNKKNDGDDDGDTMEEDDVRVRRATMREADAELLRWRQLLASDVANVRHLRTFLQHLRHNINMMDLQRKAHRAKMVQLRKAQKLAKVVQRMRQRPQMSVDEVVDDLDENFFSENNNNKHRNREWKRKQMRHLLTGDADDDDVRDDDDIVEEMDFDVQDVVGSEDDVVDDVVGYMSGSENDDGSIASMEWDVDDDDDVGRRSPLFGVDVEDILDGLVDAEVTSVMEEDVLDAFETHFVQQLVSVADVDEIDDDVVAELEGYSDVDEIEYPPAWRSRTTKRAAAPSTSFTSLVVDEVEDLINDDETSPQQQQQHHLPSSSSASSVAEREASDVDGSIHSNNKSSTEHEHDDDDDDDALEMMEDLLAEDEEEMNELRADIERTRPRRQRALRQVRPTTFTEIYTTQETPHDDSKDDDDDDDDGDDASSSPQQEHVVDAAQHVDDGVEVAPQAEVAPHPPNDVVALHDDDDDDVQHASTNVGTDLAMDFSAQVSWVEQQRRLFSDILPVTSRAQHINDDDDDHDDVQVRAFTHHWGVVESLMQTKFGRHRVWPSYQLMSDEDEDGGDDDDDDVLDDWSSELDTSTYSSDA